MVSPGSIFGRECVEWSAIPPLLQSPARPREEKRLSKLPYILTAIAIGGVLTIQPGLNAEVARRVASPLGAGLLSIFVSFVLSLAIVFGSRQNVAWSALPALRF